MRLDQIHDDKALLNEIGNRISTLRLNSNLTQAGLSDMSGVSKRTVERLESGEGVQTTSLIRIFRSLGLISRLEALLPEPVVSPIAQLKLQKKVRRRAHPKKKNTEVSRNWTWENKE